jgi:hypothetical protein
MKNRTWVITSAISDVPINQPFLTTLHTYCERNKAELLIVPIKYDQDGTHEYSWPAEIHKHFIDKDIKLTKGLRLLAGVRLSPAIGNPLSGYESFCKGDSILLPHPSLAMKSIATSHRSPPVIAYTTGTITDPVYTHTKQGSKAVFNHSYSALIVEEDSSVDGFHIRVLNSGIEGDFYDLDTYYSGKTILPNQTIDVLVLGDEHIIHADPKVTACTFTNADSLVNILKPIDIIRHDCLDFYSANHHHNTNRFTNYAKFTSGINSVVKELALTMDYIKATTPEYSTSRIIPSNHNDALTRWLNEVKIEHEPWNALVYHELMFYMLLATGMDKVGAKYPDPFHLWASRHYILDRITFLQRGDSFTKHGIEFIFHGDKGLNGSRGSLAQFAKLSTRSVIGHSHSTGILGGCYQVGLGSYPHLEYNEGPSSNIQSHCLVHKNGRRQMIFIIKGKYRR